MRFIALAFLAVSLAGCGAAHASRPAPKRDVAAERAVRASFREFEAAVLAGDGKRVCATLALASRLALRRLQGTDCETGFETFIEPLQSRPLTIGRIDVHGRRASVTLRDVDPPPQRLVREPTGWKILLDLSGFDAQNPDAQES